MARLRKERGYTQVELAEEIGLIQAIVSAIRAASSAVGRDGHPICTGARRFYRRLTRRNGRKPQRRKPSRRVLRRMEQDRALPATRQRTLF